MCFCTFQNVKKVDFVLLKMDFFWNFNSPEPELDEEQDNDIDARRCNLKCLTKFILTFVVKSHTEQRITFLSMEILGMSSISEGEKVSLDLPNRETLIPLGRAFLGITAK